MILFNFFSVTRGRLRRHQDQGAKRSKLKKTHLVLENFLVEAFLFLFCPFLAKQVAENLHHEKLIGALLSQTPYLVDVTRLKVSTALVVAHVPATSVLSLALIFVALALIFVSLVLVALAPMWMERPSVVLVPLETCEDSKKCIVDEVVDVVEAAEVAETHPMTVVKNQAVSYLTMVRIFVAEALVNELKVVMQVVEAVVVLLSILVSK